MAVKHLIIVWLVVAVLGAIVAVFMQLRYQELVRWEYYVEVLVIFFLYGLGVIVATKVSCDNENEARRQAGATLLSYLRKALLRLYIYPYVGFVAMISVIVIVWQYFADLPTWLTVLLVTLAVLASKECMSLSNSDRIEKLKAEIAQLKAEQSSGVNRTT